MDKGKSGFDDVYEEFHVKIRRYVERMVGRDEADDLIQVVFMKVNKGLVILMGTFAFLMMSKMKRICHSVE
jgi:DNA-directed RNA polymerase specialized sigma24 family protein